MREIKFRAWHKLNEELVHFDNGKLVNDQCQMQHLACLMRGDYGDVLMQYTGIKDKNGVEIYEGDVVRKSGKHYPVAYTWNEFAIEDYDNGDYCHGMDSAYHNWGSFEVIGNIHENPELME